MLFPFKAWRRQERFPDFLWALFFLGLALLLYGVNLGGPMLRDWDEGTVAQVAREVARSPLSGLFHPTLLGEPYVNKPTLMHGLVALAYRWGGITEAMARLPSALLTAVSVPMIYWVQRQLHPTRQPAVFGTMVYLTLLPVVRHGRMAMLDGAILCFGLITLGCALRSRRSPRWAWGIGFGIGLMCLTKGILGLLLGALVLVFLAWDTPRVGRSPWLWGGLLLGLAPAVGWYVNQFLSQGAESVQNSLFNQMIDRIWSPVENHRGSPAYYVLELLEWGWPWLLFWPWGLREAWRARAFSWGKLVLVWSVGFLGAITLMQTKLPWYIMPLYPMLAIAIGPVLAEAWIRGGGLNIQPFTPGKYPQVWAVFLGALAGVAIASGVYFAHFDPSPTGDYRWPLGAIAFGSLFSLVLLLRQDPQFIPMLGWTWYLGIFLLMASPHWVFELNGWPGAWPLGAMVQQVPQNIPVYTTERVERPSVNFYGDRRVMPLCALDLANLQFVAPVYLLQRPGDLAELGPSEAIDADRGWQLIRTRAENLDVQVRAFCEHGSGKYVQKAPSKKPLS